MSLNSSLTDAMARNQTALNPADEPGDATWILTSAFIIFTMQSGFGLLEAGMVSAKNEANIMVKNAIDVIFGGLAYWLFGYGFTFGSGGNPFTGLDHFMTDADEEHMGQTFSKYIFQLSFSTTATTIVSGAMAERTRLRAYIIYSFLNTLTYCFPAHWVWSEDGFLFKMGAIDVAGASAVHIVGGVSALVATLILKPRHRRFDPTAERYMASPPSAVLGTFMLWWGWLGFNCGSTFGISGHKWKLASRAAVVTINGSIGGAVFAIIYSYSRKKYKGCLNIPVFLTGILGGLVSVTAICAVCRPWEALLIGTVGGMCSVLGDALLEHIKIDDPVGCISTHFFAGTWGVMAVALLVEKEPLEGLSDQYGIFKGGPWSILYIQFTMILTMGLWAALSTAVMLLTLDHTIGLRVSLEDELIGADIVEHGIKKAGFAEYFPDDKITMKPGDVFRRESLVYNCNVSYMVHKNSEVINDYDNPVAHDNSKVSHDNRQATNLDDSVYTNGRSSEELASLEVAQLDKPERGQEY